MGWILIILAMPLFIGYALGNKNNPIWLRLGVLMAGVGVVLLIVASLFS